jgi:hypothetical protein
MKNNFETITNREISDGFINKEVIDFENSIYDGTNKKAISQAYSDLYDLFDADDFQ